MACNHEVNRNRETRGRTLAVLLSCLMAGGSSLAAAEANLDGSASADASSNGFSTNAEIRADAQAEIRSEDAQEESRSADDSSSRDSVEPGLAADERGHSERPDGPRRSQSNHGEADAGEEDETADERFAGTGEGSGSASIDASGAAEMAGRVRERLAADALRAKVSTTAEDAVQAGNELADELNGQVEQTDAAIDDTVQSVEMPETHVIADAAGNAAASTEADVTDDVNAALESTLKSDITGSVNSSVQDDIRESIRADLVSDISGSLPLPGRN